MGNLYYPASGVISKVSCSGISTGLDMGCGMWPKKIDKLQSMDTQTVFPGAFQTVMGVYLINGQFAPIIGNICMDQMLVDVTDIKEVKQGDIAVLIGKSGDLEITAYDLAEQTESITNEILSRLGARLERILI